MAGRYPAEWLDELRARADIVRTVNAYVPLKKNGHRYVGLCPFHHETAPSFSVDEQKQLYYCFGCKAGGTVIQFIMEIERLSFGEAVRFLAEQQHMPLPEMRADPLWEQKRTLKERIFLANKAAARLYHQALWLPEGMAILQYLKKRGLSDAVIRRFGIGAATASPNVGQALLGEGFTEEELVQAGLLLRREGRTFDMFRNRAIFPIIDAYGNVLGFGGRAMGDAMPKYLNTADTPAFNKRLNVFAANLLRKASKLSRVLLVEGYMDVVSLSQYGIEGVAATLGTALTPEQARLMKRYAPEIHIAYDGDKAGQKAILRGLEVLEAEHIPVHVLDFPGGLDPDEFIRQEGVEAFQALKPMTSATYRMLREKEKFDLGTEEGRTEYAKACAVILRGEEPVALEGYIRRLALETGFSTDALMRQIGVTPAAPKAQPSPHEGFVRKTGAAEKKDWTARNLLAILATGRLPKDSVTADMFDEPALRSICEALLDGESVASLMDRQPDEQSRTALAEVLAIETSDDDDVLLRMARECIRAMHRESLEHELEAIQKTLRSLPPDEQIRESARACELMKRLTELK